MTDNPLLPVVRELAEEVVRLKSGRLFAKSSTDGPRSLEELRVLLLTAGAPAAAWMVERASEDMADALDEEADSFPVAKLKNRITELELELQEWENAADDTRIEDIKEALLQREPVWKMLKAVQHILYGDDVPTPTPPATSPYGGALRPRWDDDIPF